MEGQIRYSFQPGPAQLFPQVEFWIKVALQEGLLSRYHRDPVWKGLFARAQVAVSEYLGLPEGWVVAFISSATEAWQILVDVTAHLPVLHFVQGDFGRRWFALQQVLSPSAREAVVDPARSWDSQVAEQAERCPDTRYIAAVHVETSVGAWLPDLALLRNAFPEALIAVDATSSMGGLCLPWEAVDVAFASVQKCFGLPPGLGILLLSPRMVARQTGTPRSRYNSLGYLIERAQTHEPPHTPNLLNIFLLGHLLPELPSLPDTERHLQARARWLYEEMALSGLSPIQPNVYQAPTVLAFQWRLPDEGQIVRRRAEQRGLYIGWGYGTHRDTGFRIANFPALPDAAYRELLSLLQESRTES